MTHELTDKLVKEWTAGSNIICNAVERGDRIITSYMKEKAEFLKVNVSGKVGQCLAIHTDRIDQAFGLSKKTLAEKIHDKVHKVWKENGCDLSANEVAEIARQHFKENPEDLNA